MSVLDDRLLPSLKSVRPDMQSGSRKVLGSDSGWGLCRARVGALQDMQIVCRCCVNLVVHSQLSPCTLDVDVRSGQLSAVKTQQ